MAEEKSLRQQALDKIESENIRNGTPEDMTRQLVEAWLGYDPDTAAGLIMDTGKSISGCYKHIRSQAGKENKFEVNANPECEIEWMLSYYGIDADEAEEAVEFGLMAAVFEALAKPWRPYSEKTKSQPPEDTPHPDDPEKKPARTLNLSLGDLGL